VIIIKDKIKAFIFDLDGVITDTAKYHYLGWKRLAEEEGIDFSKEDNEELRGVSRRKSLEILLDGREVSEEEKEEMMERKNGYYQEFINEITEEDLLPGIKEIIMELRKRNFKLAVASSSRNAKPVIKNLGVGDIFDTISDGHSVNNAKPAPDIFLHTAEKLEVAPESCVVIEDAKAGIVAALRANMIAVGIGPDARVGKAHYRYDQVKDIELEEILG